jgi:hypothetical protein
MGTPRMLSPMTAVLVLFAGIASLTVAACGANHTAERSTGGGAQATATTTLTRATTATTVGGDTKASFTTFNDQFDRFSIDTPSSWQQLDLSNPTAQARLKQILAQNPKLAAMAGGDLPSLLAKGLKFLSTDGVGSTADVAVIHSPGAPANPTDNDLQGGVQPIMQQITAAGGTVKSHSLVTIGGHRALEFSYDLPMAVGGTSVTVHATEAILLSKDTGYVVTAVGDNANQILASFKMI